MFHLMDCDFVVYTSTYQDFSDIKVIPHNHHYHHQKCRSSRLMEAVGLSMHAMEKHHGFVTCTKRVITLATFFFPRWGWYGGG